MGEKNRILKESDVMEACLSQLELFEISESQLCSQ